MVYYLRSRRSAKALGSIIKRYTGGFPKVTRFANYNNKYLFIDIL